jgi:hypothetical protein
MLGEDGGHTTLEAFRIAAHEPREHVRGDRDVNRDYASSIVDIDPRPVHLGQVRDIRIVDVLVPYAVVAPSRFLRQAGRETGVKSLSDQRHDARPPEDWPCEPR